MSKSSTYKLVKVSDGITFFGEVTVSLSENVNSPKISISPHVFDWLEAEYGPEATVWPVNEENEFVRGARKGVEHVIRYLPASYVDRAVAFAVERIFVSPVDSTADTVAYAACFATWQALGAEPVSPPTIRGRKIIFE